MALPVLDDQHMRLAQSRFLDGYDLPTGLLSEPVRRSWERMRQSGITPQNSAVFDSGLELAAVLDGAEPLLRAALPAMHELRGALSSPEWTVLCVDVSGTIIQSISDSRSAPDAIRVPLQTGRSVHEQQVGTNAPSCVLADRNPVIVRRAEHFLSDLGGYECAASPIYHANGDLAGVLDVTGFNARLQAGMLEHVSLAARKIEKQLFSSLPDAWLLELHFMQEFVGTSAEGLLAVSKQTGRIQGGNAAACRMLGFDLATLIDSDLDEALEIGNSGLSEMTTVYSREGRRLFIRKSPREDTSRNYMVAAKSARLGRAVHGVDPTANLALERGCKATAQGLPLLVLGETGSGKEVLARAIHQSRGPNRPFVAVNCSAIPETLIESEIFGYVDGAFTGARKGGAVGAIEQANNGTLFLDEIGDAPLPLQAKLLRVLQEGVLHRLGSRKEIKVEVTTIAATHRNLQNLIAQGLFREDLYYRLNGLTVRLPPLRERTDVLTLIDKQLASIAPTGTRPQLAAETRAFLSTYRWPGNIRQLRQVLRASLALANDPSHITLADLPSDLIDSASEYIDKVSESTHGPELTLSASKAALIQRALEETGNNVSEAARRLKISRTTVYKYYRDRGESETSH